MAETKKRKERTLDAGDPNIFEIAGTKYKMTGVNDDGTPILKSLDKLKEEKEIEHLKKLLVDTINKLNDKGLAMRIYYHGNQQSTVEFDDLLMREIFQRFF